MKQTVLKASKKLAEEISADLLNRRSPKGNPVYKRYETATGFQIKYKTSPTEEAIGFEFVDEGEGRRKFIYDERLLTFK